MAEEEKRKIDPVVKGDIEVNEGSSVWTDIKDILGGVVGDVLIPAGKDIVFDFIKTTTERALYKDDEDHYTRSGRRNYNKIYERRSSAFRGSESRSNRQRSAGGVRSRYEVDEIIFDNYADAEAVIDVLTEQLEIYQQVSIGEYYSACDLTPVSTDFNRGWYDLRGIDIVKAGRGKWTIIFPKAVPLD